MAGSLLRASAGRGLVGFQRSRHFDEFDGDDEGDGQVKLGVSVMGISVGVGEP